MATLATTNIKHASSSSNNIVLNSDGTSYIPGHIIRVVQASTTTSASNTTTTFADTNLSGTITPTSSSSKILVIVQQQMFFANNASGTGAGLKLFRDSTAIYSDPANSTGSYGQFISGGNITSMNHHFTKVIHILDSPNTTNAITYKTQFALYEAGNNGSAIVQNNTSPQNGKSFITFMEVAG